MSKRNRMERAERKAALREQLKASVAEAAKCLLQKDQRIDAVRHVMKTLDVGIAEALAFVKKLEGRR